MLSLYSAVILAALIWGKIDLVQFWSYQGIILTGYVVKSIVGTLFAMAKEGREQRAKLGVDA
jgi:hypothetical protein